MSSQEVQEVQEAQAAYTAYIPSLGTELTGTTDPSGSVVRYRGIKYGDIAKRWGKSTLVQGYPITLDARDFGSRCPQLDEQNHTKDFGPDLPFEHRGEDELGCLVLNITAPEGNKAVEEEGEEGGLPVLLWIHGGSLLFGAGSDPIWEPSVLVKESKEIGRPVVVVTINYRLGPFGFFFPPSGEDEKDGSPRNSAESLTGNLGFHDQIVALQWVQKHIRSFGGDPKRVTIAGESAGGCSVHALINYQEVLGSQRYFQRAILQSGTMGVMGYWDRERIKEIWQAAIREARYGEGSEEKGDVVEAMRELPVEKVLGLKSLDINGYGVFLDDFFVSPPLFSPSGEFLPCELDTVDAVMYGDNADEGNIFFDQATDPISLRTLRENAKAVLGEESEELLDIYGLNDDDSLNKLSTEERGKRVGRFPEDARFYLLSEKIKDVWPSAAFYHLSAKSPLTESRFPGESFHTLDLLYLFGCFDDFLRDEGKEDHLRLGKEIRQRWLSFIYGDEPWKGAFRGIGARFDVEPTLMLCPSNEVRQWGEERKRTMERLRKLDFGKVVEVATRAFP